jgi:hypothetical protein
MGFDESNVDVLEVGLLEIAQNEDVAKTETTPYGTKYVIYGTMATPVGEFIELLTVWMIDTGQENPRFITAYPRQSRRWRI